MLYWEKYVLQIDSLIRDSLVLNAQWSLSNILSQREQSIFIINLKLEEKKVRMLVAVNRQLRMK